MALTFVIRMGATGVTLEAPSVSSKRIPLIDEGSVRLVAREIGKMFERPRRRRRRRSGRGDRGA